MDMPSQKATWVGLVIAVLGFATAYLGLDKYQASQGDTTVETIVEAADIRVSVSGMGQTRSNQDIQAMIDRAVEARMEDHLTKEGRH